MVSVAKPWLICGYHGLTLVTMFLNIEILNIEMHFRIVSTYLSRSTLNKEKRGLEPDFYVCEL